jgi:hypothetical protein
MCMIDPAGQIAERAAGTSVLWVVASQASQRSGPIGPLPRRFRRGVELAWSPVDVVLAARDLSNLVVVAATLVVAILCAHHGGLTSLIMNLPALAVVWGAAYGVIRLGRWWRGVGPSDHEPPRHQR